jgi:hypothetical protein
MYGIILKKKVKLIDMKMIAKVAKTLSISHKYKMKYMGYEGYLWFIMQ